MYKELFVRCGVATQCSAPSRGAAYRAAVWTHACVWEARNVRCIEQTQGCCPARVVMVKRYEFLVERCCDGVDEFLQCGEGGNSGVVCVDAKRSRTECA